MVERIIEQSLTDSRTGSICFSSILKLPHYTTSTMGSFGICSKPIMTLQSPAIPGDVVSGELGAGGGVVELVVHRGGLARHLEHLRHPAEAGLCSVNL